MPGDRRLVAIMFTDVKGYSAMMGADEPTTLRVVREHREIVRSILPEHGGVEQKTIGDAFLVLFDSSVHAVQCAIAIQERLLARNREVSKKEQVWVRIGVHVGDVAVEEGDVFGEAVNIAARVEPQAPPGGVCFTETVYAQVRGRVAATIEPMGVVPLKNIEHPPALYRIAVAPFTPVRSRRRWPAAVAAAMVALAAIAFFAWVNRAGPRRFHEASDDPRAQARFIGGMEAIERGDGALACRMAEAGVQIDPDSSDLWLLRATCGGTLTGALVAAERAAKLAPPGPEGDLARLVGRVAAGGDSGSIKADWDTWAADHPDDEWGLLMRIANRPVDDPVADRVALLEAFVSRWPDNASARILLANGLDLSGRPLAAIGELQVGLARCPECAVLEFTIGDILEHYGQYEDAKGYYEHAALRDPSLVLAGWRLAEMALRSGDLETWRRKSTAIMNDAPIDDRIAFADTDARELFMFGYRTEGRALMERGIALAADRDPARRLSMLAMLGVMEARMQDGPALRRVIDRLRDVASQAEMPVSVRDAAALDVTLSEAYAAWIERDRAALDATVARLDQVPPDRFVYADRDRTLAELHALRASVAGQREEALAALRQTPEDCRRESLAGQVLEVLGQPDQAAAAYRLAFDAPCPNSYELQRVPMWIAIGEDALAHHNLDEVDSMLLAVHATWRAPDPDLPLVARLHALEERRAAAMGIPAPGG